MCPADTLSMSRAIRFSSKLVIELSMCSAIMDFACEKKNFVVCLGKPSGRDSSPNLRRSQIVIKEGNMANDGRL